MYYVSSENNDILLCLKDTVFMLQNSAFMSNAKLGFHVRRKSQVLQHKSRVFQYGLENFSTNRLETNNHPHLSQTLQLRSEV
jgi:hypothetical protein